MSAPTIEVYAKRGPRESTVLGRLVFGGFSGTGGYPGGVRLEQEWTPNAALEVAHGVRWLWLEAELLSNTPAERPAGRIIVEENQRPSFTSQSSQRLQWIWRPSLDDLEQIEADWAPNVDADRGFRLSVRGLVDLDGRLEYAEGYAFITIALSDWGRVLIALDYGVPPSVTRLVGPGSTSNPSWREASARLARARESLREGDGHMALTRYLGEFERLVSNPYRVDRWSAWLRERYPSAEMPDQKLDSISRLLSAHCTYLNRVGHHRERESGDGGADLPQIALAHWEAELISASNQALLAYALRLDSARTVAAPES